MSATILIVEDNEDLLQSLAFTIERGGFLVETARSVSNGFLKLKNQTIDLVLLDIILPDNSGYELCRLIRERKSLSHLPVIFLSAKTEEIDRVVAFEVGADDYITKPFSVKELLLRIQAILRRKNSNNYPTNFNHCSFGILTLDLSIPRVMVADHEITLTVLEMRLLELLFARQGRVQSRVQLLNSVWKIDADITTRTVDTHIKRLREKLGPAANYIKTIRGLGYRMIDTDELTKK